jgi:DNA-binding response OmpR family regulator
VALLAGSGHQQQSTIVIRASSFLAAAPRRTGRRLWGLRQGAKNYVVKPVDEKDLLTKITALNLAAGATP